MENSPLSRKVRARSRRRVAAKLGSRTRVHKAARQEARTSRARGKKRRIYLDAGVEEYWIVDIDAQLIERWRPGQTRPEMAGMLQEGP